MAEGEQMNSTNDPTTIATIHAIAKRAAEFHHTHGGSYPVLDATMDLDACHSNGCALDLDALLEADQANFTHDVCGIRAHLDRDTGQLVDCFLPRYAAKAPAPSCQCEQLGCGHDDGPCQAPATDQVETHRGTFEMCERCAANMRTYAREETRRANIFDHYHGYHTPLGSVDDCPMCQDRLPAGMFRSQVKGPGLGVLKVCYLKEGKSVYSLGNDRRYQTECGGRWANVTIDTPKVTCPKCLDSLGIDTSS